MERGFLDLGREGYQSSEAAADFERCLRLSDKLTDDELFTMLIALANYYLVRADLRRAAQVIDSLQGREDAAVGRPSDRHSVRGDGVSARRLARATAALDAATAGVAEANSRRSTRGRPTSRSTSGCLYRAFVALVRGDLAELRTGWQVGALADGFGFPRAVLRTYTRSMEVWLRIDRPAGPRRQRRRRIDLCLRTSRLRYVAAGRCYLAGCRERTGRARHADDLATPIKTLTTSLDELRSIEVNIFTTLYDGILGRLLLAAGQPNAARDRLNIGLTLAHDTGMHFYDAELLRLRAQTLDDPAARQADINRALELGRRQTATLFELRAALDDFKLRGNAAADAVAAAANRIPANGAWPELAEAKTALSERSQQIRDGPDPTGSRLVRISLTSTPSPVSARGYN